MKSAKVIVLLFLIILIGFTVRFYRLGSAPAGLYLDEAAQGYNAYSILKTGKDEFGMPCPAAFRSFNDFKTPIYIYHIVPLIPLFGLNQFSIRFPSFLLSILTLPLVYLLITHLCSNSVSSKRIGLLTALFLAISPWHTLFGRTNFECNVALFWMLLGVLLFLYALKKPYLLLVSALSFSIALPAYHSERLLVPLILIYLAQFHRTLFSKSHRPYLFISLVIGILLAYPTLKIITTPGFLARVSTLNIFTSDDVRPWFLPDLPDYMSTLANNNLFLSVKEFLSLYVSYFSPRYLFLLGDSGPRSSYPDLSVLYLWQLPFYLHGLYLLFTKKNYPNLRRFLLMMFIISPIPAALTRDPFSTIRALPLVVPLSIIIAMSVDHFYMLTTTKLKQNVFIFGFFLIIIYSLLKLYSSGLVLNEYYRASFWDYGWKEVASVIQSTGDNLPVVVDSARNEPYSQLLVYLLPDPTQYQKDNFEVSNTDYYTDMTRKSSKIIGRVITRGINWIPDTSVEQYLVGDFLAISEEQIQKNNLKLIKQIDYPDGSPAFRIVKTQPNLVIMK